MWHFLCIVGTFFMSTPVSSAPLYDCDKTFQENWQKGPYCTSEIPTFCRQTKLKNICGHMVASSIGISACAIMNAKGIHLASQWGYDVFVYKTVRSEPFQAHAWPNVVEVNEHSVCYDSLPLKAQVKDKKISAATVCIANSIGNASSDLNTSLQGVSSARASLSSNQLLIVSIYGSDHYDAQGKLVRSLKDDFAFVAQAVYKAGAQIIEANLSCPNIASAKKYAYWDPVFVGDVVSAIKKAVPEAPLFVKLGFFDSFETMRTVLETIVSAGGQGICGINSMPCNVTNENNEPAFGKGREICGLSGSPIKDFAYAFVCMARRIIVEEKLPLVLCAMGGVEQPCDIDRLLHAGADLVFSATRAMWHPQLAIEYHSWQQDKKALARLLKEVGALKIGNFVLRSGKSSSYYLDMRLIPSYPEVFAKMVALLSDMLGDCHGTLLCGVPFGAVPFAVGVALKRSIPFSLVRKEVKKYGTQRQVEGCFAVGDQCIVFDDVMTTGGSIEECIAILEKEGLKIRDIVVIVDRQEGGRQKLEEKGYRVHALYTINELFEFLQN